MAKVKVVGFNVIGWDERGEPIEGSIALLECEECGARFWATDRHPENGCPACEG